MSQGSKCLVAALVLVLSGCAAVGGNTVPPSVDVSGKWAGTWSFHNPTMGSGDVFMNLKQSGADATGDLMVTGPTTAEPHLLRGHRQREFGHPESTLPVRNPRCQR